MPTWGQILEELNAPANQKNGGPDFDGLRRRYLARLHKLTGRAAIVYATAFLDRPELSSRTQIEIGDVQGFMNAVASIQEKGLDLILTSQGGSAEAAELIVAYLRTRFDHIRVFVPVAAMSAATMVALGADVIVLGSHSQLGPIDPQFTISTPEGPRSAPAAEILEQFARAQRECADPTKLPAWMPILRTYAPGLLSQCHTSRDLAATMVKQWLATYMLKGQPDADDKAKKAATWFSDYKQFGSHGRRVARQDLLSLGLKADALEDDNDLQDAVLSIHHAYSHTFAQTAAAKIIESHNGHAYVRIVHQPLTAIPINVAPPAPVVQQPAAGAQGQGRAERRRQKLGR